ncbi:hypothetical protein WQE_20256 [Paraburkholderia hospita]|uniref:DUF3293 domain-containing protein n=1 Tax=Paraburkholderia hospita TaxID=169430 RepID=A0ABP2PN98_9BURK|nr:DUF3293 domain-containing protein [Paraburkholderia hospita]EIM99217.1 hypothetical protein WQE_20256 [Paraburkholderia hospita]OUL72500.1 hypothetical protein CA602_43480 [Paraburkholderia hospita]
MNSASAVDPDTINAYLETHYLVGGDMPTTLRVCMPNASLAALHEAAGVESSAFITACNPFSRHCDDESNARRQEALAHQLTQLRVEYVDGIGQHPSTVWGEPSFLALGLALETAKELGRRYEQNAIVWCGRDAVPQLVLLR